jgi:hypothetical protein
LSHKCSYWPKVSAMQLVRLQYCWTQMIQVSIDPRYTVQPAHAVISIKQSPVLKGRLFLVLSLNKSYDLNLFKEVTCLIRTFFLWSKCDHLMQVWLCVWLSGKVWLCVWLSGKVWLCVWLSGKVWLCVWLSGKVSLLLNRSLPNVSAIVLFIVPAVIHTFDCVWSLLAEAALCIYFVIAC